MRRLARRHLPQAVRRVLVALYFLLAANGVAVFFLGFGGGGKERDLIALGGVVIAVVLGGLFYIFSTPVDLRPSGLFDERQNAVRVHAMADAYRLLVLLLLAGYALIALQTFYGFEVRILMTPRESVAFQMMPLVMLLPSLPQALAAWRETDADAVEDQAASR